MSQKIALVSGASSGLGKVIVKQLARDGFYVFATARSKEKLEAMRSEYIEPLVLDVTKDADVMAAVEYIIKTKGQLDVLVNNAGYGYAATIEDGSIKNVKSQFEVNYFGVMRLTQAVLPHMRERKSGRIINMSSLVGQVSYPIFGYYASTKHALEAFSDSLRMEMVQFGVKVVLIEPGAIKTGFGDIMLRELEGSHKTKSYEILTNAFKREAANTYRRAPGADVIAKVIHQSVVSKSPKRRYVVGIDAKFLIFLKNKLGAFFVDYSLLRMLKINKRT